MQIIDHSSGFSDSTHSFIEFLSNLNFKDVLQDEANVKSAAIIKVGDMTYRVSDSDLSSDESGSKDFSDTVASLSDNTLNDSNLADLSRDPLPPLLQLQIIPVQPDVFLAQLPHHLSSFIQEVVSIVKQYNVKTNMNEYKFQFQRLNLDIMLSKQNDLLKIIIQVGDTSLQQDLNSERQQAMIHFLNDTLDATEIEVEFDFLSQYSGQSGGQSSQSDQSNQEDSDDQDSDNT
tara:strand:- start:37 stop:732 length:696 start_codon:yes stop_codon:yes gene_type:complete